MGIFSRFGSSADMRFWLADGSKLIEPVAE